MPNEVTMWACDSCGQRHETYTRAARCEHQAVALRQQRDDLIEETLRLAAEDGVWLEAPDEYRKAKEKAAKDAARKAAKAA